MPIVRAAPRELADKLELAQLYHGYLEHQWYMVQQAGYDIPGEETVTSYIENILPSRRDKAVLIESGPGHASILSVETNPDP